MGDYKYVLYEKKDAVCTITMNIPDKMNVVDFPWEEGICDDLLAAIDEAELADDVKIIVFKGAGKHFCAGHDLTKIYKVYENFDKKPGYRRPSQYARLKIDKYWYEMEHKILISNKITIAQAQGYCLGEGALIAESCDFTIVANDAKVGHPEQRMGFCGSGIPTIPILYLKIGYTRARDLLLTGRHITGEEAARIGWATKAVPEENLDEEVAELCRLMSVYPRDGIAIGKATNHLILDALGMTRGWPIGYYSHTLFTNLRYEEGEFNFVRERAKKGARESFHERDKKYEGKE